MANVVLDVFEECLRKVNRIISGSDVDGGAEESELAKQ
jgi:hypothetical protein